MVYLALNAVDTALVTITSNFTFYVDWRLRVDYLAVWIYSTKLTFTSEVHRAYNKRIF